MSKAIISDGFDLEQYLTHGVENVVRQMTKITNFSGRETKFMAQYALASKKASALRRAAEEQGEHIPPFLIASITSICNLHCAGCYARSLDSVVDGEPVDQMSGKDWGKVFAEAREMGVGFILLAGGEPMVRRDVMEEAAKVPEILFPVFTNGTMLGADSLSLFDEHRNLVPILSIEGGAAVTDARRGTGVFQKAQTAMAEMKEKKIVFGVSVTVTSQNLEEVTSREFLSGMEETGCKAVIFVEFVPTNDGLQSLCLSSEQREQLSDRLAQIRGNDDAMLLISFPGDEKSSGGCLAAGRGFFHINSHGGAEPCPFSPYSDISVKNASLKEVLHSRLFRELREQEILNEEHEGGCVLFRKRSQVEEILNRVG